MNANMLAVVAVTSLLSSAVSAQTPDFDNRAGGFNPAALVAQARIPVAEPAAAAVDAQTSVLTDSRLVGRPTASDRTAHLRYFRNGFFPSLSL
ncbi:MAG: hypothetical protein HYZ74_00710, partial [Elusimicrobia bacterium]|nr:hypothetical protein [Elusimicrobiota bacterium]